MVRDNKKESEILYLIQDDRSLLYLKPLTEQEEMEAKILYNSEKYKAIRRKFMIE